ncbi:MAG: hypothetical protein E5V92_17805 [Mesorhizobium sp.]|nr:MAG: hypothetical protein EOS61_25195 [Mesorhizobium sp.]TJW83596.1 MAG: hypothetical protein E5V92_17805 [Mesorhizobium sp.]
MANNLRRDDAEAIVQLVLKNSKALNEFLIERKDVRSKEEFDFLKKIVGRLMGAQYFDAIEVVKEKYSDIMDKVHGPVSDMKFEFPKSKKR